jgi:hypothetical protein
MYDSWQARFSLVLATASSDIIFHKIFIVNMVEIMIHVHIRKLGVSQVEFVSRTQADTCGFSNSCYLAQGANTQGTCGLAAASH